LSNGWRRAETRAQHHAERDGILVEAGWRCRLDGPYLPPAEWRDTRAYSAAAAWDAQCERDADDADAELGPRSSA
jgi:hypothetical protein